MSKPRRIRHSKMRVRESISLLILCLPTIFLTIMFSYVPMYGITLAFKNYKIPHGILGSAWQDPWYKNFQFLIESNYAWRMTRNTIGLNMLFIVTTMAAAVAFALLMYEVKKRAHVKAYQTVSILPSFLSWIAVSYIVYALLEPGKGIINQIIIACGGEGLPWYSEPKYWPWILMIVRIWHGTGYASILYYASLMGIDDSMLEAAELDGANKWQRIRYIFIPHLTGLMVIRFVLNIGSIFHADFGLFYNVTRNIGKLYPTTDVIDSFIYRTMMTSANFTLSSAASVVQSVVGTCLLLLTNFIVKKIDPDKALF